MSQTSSEDKSGDAADSEARLTHIFSYLTRLPASRLTRSDPIIVLTRNIISRIAFAHVTCHLGVSHVYRYENSCWTRDQPLYEEAETLDTIQLRLSSNHDRHKVNGLGCGLSVSSDRNTEQMEPLGGRDLCSVNFLVSRGLMRD